MVEKLAKNVQTASYAETDVLLLGINVGSEGAERREGTAKRGSVVA
jgi:hypothetical protein